MASRTCTLLAFFGLGSVALSCASQMYCESPSGPCMQGGDATDAVVTAAAAGTVWVAGGGCAVAGCRYPMVCNQGSGLCESPRCGEHRDCAAGMRCNLTTSVCE